MQLETAMVGLEGTTDTETENTSESSSTSLEHLNSSCVLLRQGVEDVPLLHTVELKIKNQRTFQPEEDAKKK